MKETRWTWVWATVAAFILAGSGWLDGPSEHEAAQDVAADLQSIVGGE